MARPGRSSSKTQEVSRPRGRKAMSMTELPTRRNPANGFVTPSEVGEVQAGNPLPIGGAHEQGKGVNFVLFSRHATGVRLEFYENSDDSSPSRIIELDPVRHRTGDVWHVWVRAFPQVNSTVIASRGRICPKRVTGSTRINCFWIHMQEHLRGWRIGIFQLRAATIPPAS